MSRTRLKQHVRRLPTLALPLPDSRLALRTGRVRPRSFTSVIPTTRRGKASVLLRLRSSSRGRTRLSLGTTSRRVRRCTRAGGRRRVMARAVVGRMRRLQRLLTPMASRRSSRVMGRPRRRLVLRVRRQGRSTGLACVRRLVRTLMQRTKKRSSIPMAPRPRKPRSLDAAMANAPPTPRRVRRRRAQTRRPARQHRLSKGRRLTVLRTRVPTRALVMVMARRGVSAVTALLGLRRRAMTRC